MLRTKGTSKLSQRKELALTTYEAQARTQVECRGRRKIATSKLRSQVRSFRGQASKTSSELSSAFHVSSRFRISPKCLIVPSFVDANVKTPNAAIHSARGIEFSTIRASYQSIGQENDMEKMHKFVSRFVFCRSRNVECGEPIW